MSSSRFFPFKRGKPSNDVTPSALDDAKPTLNLHVPAFGGVVMKPVSDLGGRNDPTILAGQVEIHLPTRQGLMCRDLLIWIEGRWTDVEGKKDKGTTVCFEQKAEIDLPENREHVWLRPGRQRYKFKITLPSTLPRNAWAPGGRLLYWLVGTIQGLPDGRSYPTDLAKPSVDNSPSSPNKEPSTSTPPVYSDSDLKSSDVKWLQDSVRTERRIAISHNPNADGGVSRLDDDFMHDLRGFGTCRIQVRVNEWCMGCYFPVRVSCLALSPLATLLAIRINLVETITVTPPNTGRPTVTKRVFSIISHGQVPQHLLNPPDLSTPALWRGKQAGGEDRGDFVVDLLGKLPVCENSLPTTLPGMHMPGIGVPVRTSHKLVHEVYFTVFAETGAGTRMPVPGPGGVQLMRRVVDVVVPQCVFVSEILNLPSYSTVFGENIRRTDQYFYHRIEANLPCPTCHIIPLHNLCTTCPGDSASHVQHSKPPPQTAARNGSDSKSKGTSAIPFDPVHESCPTCSGESVLPSEDPNYHLCGCEIEGRKAAYHVVWDEPPPTIAK